MPSELNFYGINFHQKSGYQKTALNCWIASLLYFTALCASAQQFWANHRIGDDQFKVS